MSATLTLVRVRLHPRIDGAHRSWAKALSGVDADKTGGYALEGSTLQRGAAYDLPEGLLIVLVDKWETRKGWPVEVALCRVSGGEGTGLEVVRTWRNQRGKIGPQILKGIARHWKSTPPPPRPAAAYAPAVAAPPMTNRWDGKCHRCGHNVPAGTGYAERVRGRLRNRHRGLCPPRRNDHPGCCMVCVSWIEARKGLLVHVDDLETNAATLHLPRWQIIRIRRLGEGNWRLVHDGACPPDDQFTERPEKPGPLVNSWPGECEICWQHIPKGQGRLFGRRGERHLVHPEDCPTNPYNPDRSPTWRIVEDEDNAAYDYPTGIISRVSMYDGPPDGPGWRLLAGGHISVIGVVVSSFVRKGRLTTVWRTATEVEAAPVLDREAARLERAGLTGRTRALLAVLPNTAPPDAIRPAEEELERLTLAGLPTVWIPLGAARPETCVYLDKRAGAIWTVVANHSADDPWELSNYGGAITYRHPLTPERAALLKELRAFHERT